MHVFQVDGRGKSLILWGDWKEVSESGCKELIKSLVLWVWLLTDKSLCLVVKSKVFDAVSLRVRSLLQSGCKESNYDTINLDVKRLGQCSF